VGINYAVQDAVATANVLGPHLLAGTWRVADLAAVQRRRALPTRLMQAMQRQMAPFTRAGRPTVQPRLLARLMMSLPIVAELRDRLIANTLGAPAAERDQAPVARPRPLEIAARVGHGIWSAMCQLDPRAFAMFGVPMYFADTPPRQTEDGT